MQDFSFSTVKTIINELGCCHRQLGTIAKSLAITRVLVVTDAGIVQSGMIEPALASLTAMGVVSVVYTDVVADPPEIVVERALTFAREQQIDGVIGLGGGSSMDVAKVIALLTKSSQSLQEVYGVGNAKGTRLPLIQIPTTAGTGSEVTPISIITTGETTKQGIVSPLLIADVALLDAELTVGLPPHVTAATGIDAMVHAIEAYTSKHRKNPYSDMLACEALRLLSKHIVTAVEDGHNLIARSAMLYGAMLAGQAFAEGYGKHNTSMGSFFTEEEWTDFRNQYEYLIGEIAGRSKIRFLVDHGESVQYTDNGVAVFDTAVRLSGV